jgi:hypothetical protein
MGGHGGPPLQLYSIMQLLGRRQMSNILYFLIFIEFR